MGMVNLKSKFRQLRENPSTSTSNMYRSGSASYYGSRVHCAQLAGRDEFQFWILVRPLTDREDDGAIAPTYEVSSPFPIPQRDHCSLSSKVFAARTSSQITILAGGIETNAQRVGVLLPRC
jgi:hypothetical protein